jgi:hypothetical protein
MAKELNPIEFLQNWYRTNCNGEWEKVKGITIETMETPGWHVTIDLAETPLSGVGMRPVKIERGPADWIDCRVEHDRFLGMGDAAKLPAILQTFEKFAKRTRTPKGDLREGDAPGS